MHRYRLSMIIWILSVILKTSVGMCKDGFYLYIMCYPCLSSCQTCSFPNIDRCDTCKPGFWGTSCNNRCATGCEGGVCKIDDGNCKIVCPSQCALCSHSGVCTTCRTGYYGHQCSQTCPGGWNDGCDINTGVTSGLCSSCKDGYFGQFCDVPCNDTCINSQCNRTGECTTGCITNHYGPKCENLCSSNCKPTLNGLLCDDQGGCLEGCFQGFTGDDCMTGKQWCALVIGHALVLRDHWLYCCLYF